MAGDHPCSNVLQVLQVLGRHGVLVHLMVAPGFGPVVGRVHALLQSRVAGRVLLLVGHLGQLLRGRGSEWGLPPLALLGRPGEACPGLVLLVCWQAGRLCHGLLGSLLRLSVTSLQSHVCHAGVLWCRSVLYSRLTRSI